MIFRAPNLAERLLGTDAGTVVTDGRKVEIARRTLDLLVSPQLLVFAYVLSVLLDQKMLIYLAVCVNLLSINWTFSIPRAGVFVVLASAIFVYFVTPEKVNAAGTFLIAVLGLFDAGRRSGSHRAESRVVAYATVAIIVVAYAFTNRFDFNEGVVSHNFIPIACLYVMLAVSDWTRRELSLLGFVIAVVAFSAGSRSGSAVFLFLSLAFWSPRLAVLIACAAALALVLGIEMPDVPGQFQRNYETASDPRLFIWTEFIQLAAEGRLFRTETFDFMGTFGLERNFHNSLFEAYYRLGPLAACLLALHVAAIWKNRHDIVLAGILVALLLKGLFDSFLWFTPVDLIVFRLYGAQLFSGGRA